MLTARVFRKKTLLRKASEPIAHVAGFEFHSEGHSPPNHPYGFLIVCDVIMMNKRWRLALRMKFFTHS